MSSLLDLRGRVFTRLTVLSLSSEKNVSGRIQWNCICECGNLVVAPTKGLRNGHNQSCGCLRVIGITSHGHALVRTPTYITWTSMRQRCYRKANASYKYYGARGIRVCRRWYYSFENFLEDMGERPEGMTIDRIDPDGHYVPSNCRWATPLDQRHNWRSHG